MKMKMRMKENFKIPLAEKSEASFKAPLLDQLF